MTGPMDEAAQGAFAPCIVTASLRSSRVTCDHLRRETRRRVARLAMRSACKEKSTGGGGAEAFHATPWGRSRHGQPGALGEARRDDELCVWPMRTCTCTHARMRSYRCARENAQERGSSPHRLIGVGASREIRGHAVQMRPSARKEASCQRHLHRRHQTPDAHPTRHCTVPGSRVEGPGSVGSSSAQT